MPAGRSIGLSGARRAQIGSLNVKAVLHLSITLLGHSDGEVDGPGYPGDWRYRRRLAACPDDPRCPLVRSKPRSPGVRSRQQCGQSRMVGVVAFGLPIRS